MPDDDAKVKRGRRARNTGASQAANRHVGERIRIRRTLAGLSQSDLGKAIGFSFQQVQKYERGINTIGAGQLCQIAEALDLPISFFYDGLDGVSVSLKCGAETQGDRFARHELEMLGHYRAAPDPVRDAVRSLLGCLANPDPRQDRDVEGGSAEQESFASVSPSTDGTDRIPPRDGADPDTHSVENEFPDLGTGVEPTQRATVGLSGSVAPGSGQARSATRDQQASAGRGRGRPRKGAVPYGAPAVAEPAAVRSRSGENAASSSETTTKVRRRQGAVWDPMDVVTSPGKTGRPPAGSTSLRKPKRSS